VVDGKDVRPGDFGNMDIVADAGTVASVIVVAVDNE
jgi:hypothetical protein